MNELEHAIEQTCPFPHLNEKGKLKDGLFIQQPRICRECSLKSCAQMRLSEKSACFRIHNCSRGLCFVVFDFYDVRLIVNGLLVPGYYRKLSKNQKKRLSIQNVSESSLSAWHKSTLHLIEGTTRYIEDSVKTNLSMLHDVKTSVSIILRNTEVLINEEDLGNSIEDKIENASHARKTLYKSVNLLEERLSMLDLISNPKSARYGERKYAPIYRIVDKFAKLFQQTASAKRIQIRMSGSSYKNLRVYDSFSTIPLVLIDNAVKYSLPAQDVVIEVNDDAKGGVVVAVRSISPLIQPNYRERIFSKGFRCPFAQKVTSKGAGLGLYLATIVGQAHGIKIQYTTGSTTFQKDEIMYGENIFSFTVT